MASFSEAPQLVKTEIRTDYENDPSKFVGIFTYRAYDKRKAVEVQVVKTALYEDSLSDPDYFVDLYAGEVADAYTALGYSL